MKKEIECLIKSLNMLKENGYKAFTVKTLKQMYYTKHIRQTTLKRYLKQLVKSNILRVEKRKYNIYIFATEKQITQTDFITTLETTHKKENRIIRELSKFLRIDKNELDSSLTEEYSVLLERLRNGYKEEIEQMLWEIEKASL